MNLYYISSNTTYNKYTLQLAIPYVAEKLNLNYKEYNYNEFCNKLLCTDSDKCILILEGYLCKDGRPDLKYLRSLFPNAIIIMLGSDTINYKNYYENQHVENIDLFLDLMPDVVDFYKNIGIKSDRWYWTISEVFVRRLEEINTTYDKTIDISCLLTIEENNKYRLNLKNYLNNNFKSYLSNNTFCGGFDNSYDDISFINELHKLYNSSYVILGTSSPSWTQVRTMKGFRDWISPFCGSLLIHDNFKPFIDINENNVVPLYDYDDFNSIGKIVNNIKNLNDNKYNNIISAQKKLALELSLENQLTNQIIKCLE